MCDNFFSLFDKKDIRTFNGKASSCSSLKGLRGSFVTFLRLEFLLETITFYSTRYADLSMNINKSTTAVRQERHASALCDHALKDDVNSSYAMNFSTVESLLYSYFYPYSAYYV